jgi:uncharacterized protein
MHAPMTAVIIEIILKYYPAVQGIYLFGSHGTEKAWPTSDIDIALLLPPAQSREEQNLSRSRCRGELEEALHQAVDLLNARQVATVFQKEIIAADRLLYCPDRYAVDEFEIMVMSAYQKLNEERRDILASFHQTGRAYAL